MSDLKLNNVTPDGIGKIKLGSSDVSKIYSGSTLVWPISSDPVDPYDPVEGQNFRFIASKTASPYFGLFDDTLSEVNTPYTFAPVPDYPNSKVVRVSDNYTYMLSAGANGSGVVHLSTDNGESWGALPFSSNGRRVHMSKSGQVIAVETGGYNNAVIEVSNNFGNSFTTFNLDNVITLGTSVSLISKLALSSGGKFITVSVFANGIGNNSNYNRILKSSDYGNSFSDITDSVGFPFTDARFDVNIQDALISGDGKYEIYFNAWGVSRYSDDYGQTFINKSYQQLDWNENGQINESGQYFMLTSSASPGRYSTDFGVSTSLGSVANSGSYDLGVSNSGEFSFISATSAAALRYSDDFFATFTTIGPVTGVGEPFILVDQD